MNAFKNPLKDRATQAAAKAPAQPQPQAPQPPAKTQAQAPQPRIAVAPMPGAGPRPAAGKPSRPAQLHDPKSPPRDAEAVFEAAMLLSALLDEENTALRGYDTDHVATLADRKDALVRYYNDQMEAVAANPAVLDGVAPERKAAMRVIAAELKNRIDTNARLLKGNLDATRRVVSVIVDAVREDRAKAAPYGPGGVVAMDRKTGQSTALAFNKDI